MEVIVAVAALSQGIEVGRAKLSAVAAEIGKTEIVEQYDDNVRTSRKPRLREPGFAIKMGPTESNLASPTVFGVRNTHCCLSFASKPEFDNSV
jgi:hypothetical protein